MHLMYHLDTEGKRVYTLKKIVDGKATKSAHPARFSPDDKYSRHRVTLKKRFNLLPMQQSSHGRVGGPPSDTETGVSASEMDHDYDAEQKAVKNEHSDFGGVGGVGEARNKRAGKAFKKSLFGVEEVKQGELPDLEMKDVISAIQDVGGSKKRKFKKGTGSSKEAKKARE